MFHRPLVAAPLLWAGAAAAQVAVEIPFAAELGGTPFTCGVAAPLGLGDQLMRGADFRLYVADVALTGVDGEAVPVTLEEDGVWQSGGVALLDFEDATGPCVDGSPETNATLRGTVPSAPAGGWQGLSFTLGLPFALNHADATLAASPLNVSAMFWSWQGGYKYVKIDLVPEAAGMAGPEGEPAPAMRAEPGMEHGAASGAGHGAGGYFLHVGAFDCGGTVQSQAPATECGRPNRIAVSLPGFDPATQTVVIDPALVLAGADLMRNAPETAPGCMSSLFDADCAGVLPLLGLPGPEGTTPKAQRLVAAR